VSIWFVAIAYTDPLVPSQDVVSASHKESPTIAVSLPLHVHHYRLMHRVRLGLTKRRESPTIAVSLPLHVHHYRLINRVRSGLTKRREHIRCLYLVCCVRLYRSDGSVARRSIGKPQGIANDCSLIASSRLSLPLNASSAIGLGKASRAHHVSIWFVASAYTDP
jgi:hypothetical protein